MRRFAVVLLLALTSCESETQTEGYSSQSELPSSADVAAAFRFKARATVSGQELEPPALIRELAKARAVCVGEIHENALYHWAELLVLLWMLEDAQANHTQTALGMEMFEQPFQSVLDEYRAGRIEGAVLLQKSEWETRWGYDWKQYSLVTDVAIKARAQLLALNPSSELITALMKKGIANLSPDERAALPAVDVADKKHRAWWQEYLQGVGDHGHALSGEQAERMYTAQVVRDEMMAETAANWLAGSRQRRIVMLAGLGHCHDSGIVSRLKRRGIHEAVSIRLVPEKELDEVTNGATKNDYLLIVAAGSPSE